MRRPDGHTWRYTLNDQMDVSMQYEERAVVGRQGIYDDRGLVGYELLFRQLGVRWPARPGQRVIR